MEIKVLGTGCPKCKRLEQLAREAVAEAGIEAAITKVEDIDAI
ncbi:MAG: thioredoxin family protein, partial [Anaerolineae bacterium]|nr:thioredoxin family protein [Anaerolineae bacterium]